MKILAINGSMRKNRHTSSIISNVIERIKQKGENVTVDFVEIVDLNVSSCNVICSNYCSTHPFKCTIKDDVGIVLNQMIHSDVILIGSPLYFRGPPSKFQCLIERLISIFYYLESSESMTYSAPLKNKPCGLIGVTEYSNPHQILEYLHDFCMVLNMKPILLENFPYLGIAGQESLEGTKIFHTQERINEMGDLILKRFNNAN
jgi:multimeric flavodoxin WrbA